MYNAKSTLGKKMKGNVLYEVINNVAVLTVDNPPVNPLSEGFEMALMKEWLRLKQIQM